MEPFKISHICTPYGKNLFYEMYKMQNLLEKVKQHLEEGGAPKIQVEFIVNSEDLRGKEFNIVFIDEDPV